MENGEGELSHVPELNETMFGVSAFILRILARMSLSLQSITVLT